MIRRGAARLALVLGGLAALTALAAAGGYFWLQSDGGRHWLAETLAARASIPGGRVTIGTLEGHVPSAMSFGNITITDHKGPWLLIRRADLTLDTQALLTGRLDVIDLSIDQLDMTRPPLPDTEPTDAPARDSAIGGLVPVGGHGLPIPGAVRRLVVDKVVLGAAVLGGDSALIHAEGAIRLGNSSGPLSADVDLSRRDHQPGGGHLRLGYAPDSDRLDLALGFSEPAGGVLARALRLRDLPALTLTAAGSAPLSNWHGVLTAQANGQTAFQIEAAIRRVTNGLGVTLAGGGDLTSLLTPAWAGVIGHTPHLALNLLADSEGVVSLQTGSSVTLAGGDLKTEGIFETDTGRLALRFGATPQAGPMVGIGLLPPGCGWRDARIEGSIEGTLVAPTLALALKVNDLKTAALTARSLNAALRSAAGNAGGPRTLSLEAGVDYLTGAGTMMTGLAGPHPHLKVEATIPAASPGTFRALALHRIAISVAAGTITGSGNLAPRTGTFQARGHFAVNHLTRLLGPLGLPLSGLADLDFTADTGPDGGKFDITGTAGALTTGTDTLDRTLTALTDDTMRVKGTIAIDRTNGLHARDWRLEGRKFAATLQADIVNHRLEVKTKLQVPRLDAFAEPLGLTAGLAPGSTALAGSATLEARLRGTVGGPAAVGGDAKITLVTTDLTAGGRTLGRVTVEVTADGLPARPRAALTVHAAPPDTEPVNVGATILLSPDGKTLSVVVLTASQKDNTISGTARVNLDGSEPSAHFSGQWPKLESLTPLLGETVRGRGRFDVVLGRRGDQFTLLTAFGVNALRWTPKAVAPPLSLEELEAKGSFTAGSAADILSGRLNGTLTITGQGLKAGALDVTSLTASATGAAERATFQLSATAAAGALETAGTWTRSAEALEIQVTRGTGKLGTTPLALEQAAILTLVNDRVALTGLRLSGTGFQVAAEGGAGADSLKGHLEIRHLPLELLKTFNPALPNSGRLDGEIQLSGSPSDPRADAAVRFTEVGQAQAKAAGLPLNGLDGSLSAHLIKGRLGLEGDAKAGKTGAVMRFGGNLPVVFRLRPLAFEVDDTGALHGSITGSADLAALNDLLAATGDRMAGQVAVDITVDGTPTAPQLGGRLAINDGRYENQALGTVIDRISARLTGTGRTFTVEQFSGRAAGGGAVAGTGVMRLGTSGDEALDLHFTARNARLIQVDAATADVDADLTLGGSFREARLAGTVRILHADVRLPDRLPPEIVDLKVIDARRPPAADAIPGTPPRRKPLPPGTVLGILSPPAAQTPPLLAIGPAGITLALTVTAASQVLVHGRGLDSEFSCALKVGGTIHTPTIRGSLTMLRGKLDILGKDFQFKRGTIEFADDTPDPTLDMLAEAKATGITAQVQLGGRAHTPRLTLTSVPVLPPDEVLARVLFDKPASQVSALEAVQLADSASQLAGFGGSAGLVDRVRRSLGIDRLGVTTTTATATGTRRSTVEAGSYVSGDVYVGVQQGLAPDSSRAKVEVGITSALQAEVDVGVHADPQVGLKFEWDY